MSAMHNYKHQGEHRGLLFKRVIVHIAAFSVTAALLTVFLILAAGISRSSVKDNMLASAEQLCSRELFYDVLDGIPASRVDRYADSILLAIAWQLDPEHPLESAMRSAYYYRPDQNENENLRDAVIEDIPANKQYLRYWHGSIAIIKPLLCFLTLEQIYRLNGAVLAGLTLWLLVLLWRKRAYDCAAGILIGLAAVGACFVPWSLEYTWVFLLMLIQSIAVCLAERRCKEHIAVLFLVGGMLTSYLDFLTAETLTLLVPLLLYLGLIHRRASATGKELFQSAWRLALAWGAGYAGMWMLKWLLASLVLHENVLPYIGGHIAERLYGTAPHVSTIRLMTGAIRRNIACLFPLGYGAAGSIAGCLLILAAAYYGYVYRKPAYDKRLVRLLAIIGAVPYIRFLVLSNHSYIHYFFAFRAQMAAVLAAVMILAELSGRRQGKRAGNK